MKQKNSVRTQKIGSLFKKMDELKEHQMLLQQHIFDLAYSMSLQLQLLEELSKDMGDLGGQNSVGDGIGFDPKDNRIVYLKEYLERIPR